MSAGLREAWRCANDTKCRLHAGHVCGFVRGNLFPHLLIDLWDKLNYWRPHCDTSLPVVDASTCKKIMGGCPVLVESRIWEERRPESWHPLVQQNGTEPDVSPVGFFGFGSKCVCVGSQFTSNIAAVTNCVARKSADPLGHKACGLSVACFEYLFEV